MDRIDLQHPQHSPATPTMSPADHAAHTAASHTRPNPAADALYQQASADYENAARDADKLGAHTRADNHRARAAEHRALATAWTDDDNKPAIPRIPRPRPSSHLKTNPLPRQAVANA